MFNYFNFISFAMILLLRQLSIAILLVANEWTSVLKGREYNSILFQSIWIHQSNMDLNVCRENLSVQIFLKICINNKVQIFRKYCYSTIMQVLKFVLQKLYPCSGQPQHLPEVTCDLRYTWHVSLVGVIRPGLPVKSCQESRHLNIT